MQLYKVLKPFVFRGNNTKIGQEVVCSGRDGEDLIKKGLVAHADKELDPENEAHQPLIAEAEKDKGKKKTKEEKEEEKREAEKQEKLAERDAKRDKLREEAKKLVPDDGETNVEKMQKEIDQMDIDQLEVTIDQLKAAKKEAKKKK